MPGYSLSQHLTSMVFPDRATLKLQDEVAQLFEESREDVYRYLLSLGVHPPGAQEGTQEVFLRLYTSLKKGEDIQSPRAWIFRVAHNLAFKIRARQNEAAPYDAEFAAQVRAPEMNPEQNLLEQERAMHFQNAVGRLSEQQRRCLFLRLQGLRYAEIGNVLGISASTVGEFLRRAIAQLKKGEL